MMKGREIHHPAEKEPYLPASTSMDFISSCTWNLWAFLGLGAAALEIRASGYGSKLGHVVRSEMLF